MSKYLIVKAKNASKTYTAKDSVPPKPYLRTKDGYFPLTSKTSTGNDLQVKVGGSKYKIVETYTTSYETDSVVSTTFSTTSMVSRQPYIYIRKTIWQYSTFKSGNNAQTMTTSKRVTESISGITNATINDYAFYLYSFNLGTGTMSAIKSNSTESYTNARTINISSNFQARSTATYEMSGSCIVSKSTTSYTGSTTYNGSVIYLVSGKNLAVSNSKAYTTYKVSGSTSAFSKTTANFSDTRSYISLETIGAINPNEEVTITRLTTIKTTTSTTSQ